MCPLVHNYSVITLDNLHHGPKITKQLTECLFIQQLAPIAWMDSHLLFS